MMWLMRFLTIKTDGNKDREELEKRLFLCPEVGETAQGSEWERSEGVRSHTGQRVAFQPQGCLVFVFIVIVFFFFSQKKGELFLKSFFICVC